MAERSVRASMPWTWLLLVFVFFVGVVLWYALDPIVGMIVELTIGFGPSEHAEKGMATTQTVWDLWPLWFSALLAVFGIVEAIRKSGRGSIR